MGLGKAWSKQDEEQLLNMEEQGYSRQELAEHFGRTFHAIESKLNKLHIKRGDREEEPVNARKVWSKQQLKELGELVDEGWQLDELAEHFGRVEQAIRIKVLRMGKSIKASNTKWTPEEDAEFSDDWQDGSISIPVICKKYGRTWYGLRKRAQVLGLGPRPYNLEFVSVQDICEEMQVSEDRVYNWFKIGLKRKRNRSGKTKYIVDIEELLKFLETHPDYYDASKISMYLFHDEPDWLKDKRKADSQINISKRYEEYTNEEDILIQKMFCRGKSDEEIAERLHRTVGGIKCRRVILGVTKNSYMPYEIEILQKYSRYKTVDELVEMLPLRTSKGIQYKCKLLGIPYHLSKSKCEKMED